MNIEDRAHEYVLKMLENLNPMQFEKPTRDGLAYEAFELAEAMQAEALKRKHIPNARSLTKDEHGNCLHFHHEFDHKKCMDCGACLEEWQPDWSQAPDDANYWAMDKDHTANFFRNKPEITNGNGWDFGGVMQSNNSHSYQGDWKDSLRKRP